MIRGHLARLQRVGYPFSADGVGHARRIPHEDHAGTFDLAAAEAQAQYRTLEWRDRLCVLHLRRHMIGVMEQRVVIGMEIDFLLQDVIEHDPYTNVGHTVAGHREYPAAARIHPALRVYLQIVADVLDTFEILPDADPPVKRIIDQKPHRLAERRAVAVRANHHFRFQSDLLAVAQRPDANNATVVDERG